MQTRQAAPCSGVQVRLAALEQLARTLRQLREEVLAVAPLLQPVRAPLHFDER